MRTYWSILSNCNYCSRLNCYVVSLERYDQDSHNELLPDEYDQLSDWDIKANSSTSSAITGFTVPVIFVNT